MTRPNTPRVCFIGFGEAGQALASGLHDAGVQGLSAWDILFPVPAGEALRAAADRIGVRRGTSAGDAVKDADLIVAAVTAASSLDAAQAAKPFLRRDQYYLDINSVSPARKELTGKLIDEAGRYVDMAVMAPVHPARHQTPSLLAGPHAASVEPILLALDMKVSVAGPTVGAAAAIKMVRSVMVKGLEALTLECFLAARRTGVEDHGIRRAHEMEEVADTLRELGIDPHMTAGTIRRQLEMGELGKREPLKSAVPDGRIAMLDAVGRALIDEKQSN
jgi:3-hydroxyisobutyrate dehydrogenase-like beta-hydroxyacid dehydrogenase